jgi:hypothetical protein
MIVIDEADEPGGVKRNRKKKKKKMTDAQVSRFKEAYLTGCSKERIDPLPSVLLALSTATTTTTTSHQQQDQPHSHKPVLEVHGASLKSSFALSEALTVDTIFKMIDFSDSFLGDEGCAGKTTISFFLFF